MKASFIPGATVIMFTFYMYGDKQSCLNCPKLTNTG